ncbi:MAG: hypothetical protein ABMB14_34885, partial [Myxococcota bacterium]
PDPTRRSRRQSTFGFGLAVAILVAAFGAMAVQGPRALATIDLDLARQLAVRVSEAPGRLTTVSTALEMVEYYGRAGAADEGLDRFGRAVAKFDQPALVAALVFELSARRAEGEDEGADLDPHLAVALQRWIELAPDDPQALNALAWELVTRPDTSLRDPARAEGLSRESLSRIGDLDEKANKQLRAACLDTLGEILFQLGRFSEARDVQAEAVELATALEMDDLGELTSRLQKIEAADPAG